MGLHEALPFVALTCFLAVHLLVATLPIALVLSRLASRLEPGMHWTERARATYPWRLGLLLACFVTILVALAEIWQSREPMSYEETLAATVLAALLVAPVVNPMARRGVPNAYRLTLRGTALLVTSVYSRFLALFVTRAAAWLFAPRTALAVDLIATSLIVLWQVIAPWRARFMTSPPTPEWSAAVAAAAARLGMRGIESSTFSVGFPGPLVWSPTHVSATPALLDACAGDPLALEGMASRALVMARDDSWRLRYSVTAIALGLLGSTASISLEVGPLVGLIAYAVAVLVLWLNWTLGQRAQLLQSAETRALAPLPFARSVERSLAASGLPLITRARGENVYDWLIAAGAPPDYPRPASPTWRGTWIGIAWGVAYTACAVDLTLPLLQRLLTLAQ